MALVIRAPRLDEVEAVADLHLRTWQETYQGQFPESAWDENARAARISMWTQICESPREDRRFLVAELDGELVGLAAVGPGRDTPPPRSREVWFIYLLQSAQGTGAGQALLDQALGDVPASLWVYAANPRAQAFYAKNGFVPDGERRPTGIEDTEDELRMVR